MNIYCANCVLPETDHSEDKCLWQPTYFQTARCVYCIKPVMNNFYEVEMDDGRYFIHGECCESVLSKWRRGLLPVFEKAITVVTYIRRYIAGELGDKIKIHVYVDE